MRKVQGGRTQANPRGCRAPDRASTSKEEGEINSPLQRLADLKGGWWGAPGGGTEAKRVQTVPFGARKFWGWGRAASVPGRTVVGVLGVVGALAMEAAQCPVCGSILHQGSIRRNQVFALISYQVFPLVPRQKPKLWRGKRFHPWKRARAASSIVASGLASSLACRQDTAEHRFG